MVNQEFGTLGTGEKIMSLGDAIINFMDVEAIATKYS